ncbi:hypothetical protein AJ80_00762 [Polytolypa hystricis UAMH7299]|uniref:CCZ1/INTU/HSP4 first Longin domain-containing protein n=1 Tax=Polytolypa hystricis (strain UAMH7299) TaxID=1447883 RepID=A0A2B7Z2F0_POLH7|nr:hypothetical protein AJ80_00762 [Polytolypa hystricis UAMH7299]
MSANDSNSVVPAQLSFLAIYNPSLGTTDETLSDQIVFYFSKNSRTRNSRAAQRGSISEQNEDQNEKLRQVGLAQGMVSFAKNFSNGEAVDTVETEKSRIVLHELEAGWWILASIDFTRIASAATSHSTTKSAPRVEYSSREVSPPQLILTQLLRAYSTFLLHHAPSLDILYKRLSRSTFCGLLDRFWTRFIWNWDVLLNGNPAVDIFDGVKVAGSGELGIGVGEEEWGSGEREVLEDFVSRTDGLVDLVVSRFGEAPSKIEDAKPQHSATPDPLWIGADVYPRPSDGIIFSGVGAVSRRSLTRVSQWMEWIYRYGEDAYGVREDPKSIKRRKRRKVSRNKEAEIRNRSTADTEPLPAPSPVVPPPSIPPPLITGSRPASRTESARASSRENTSTTKEQLPPPERQSSDSSPFGTDTVMKLLTLGYGSSWGTPARTPPPHPRVNFLRFGTAPSEDKQDTQEPLKDGRSMSEASSMERAVVSPLRDDYYGEFIIGLRDDLELEESDDDNLEENDINPEQPKSKTGKSKTMVRTLNVALHRSSPQVDAEGAHLDETHKELQVVVYLYQPFMFTFLFEPGIPSLSSPSFYRSIHHQLGPLQKPLLQSTSADKASQRTGLYELYRNPRDKASTQQEPLYDIVFDPCTQLIHTSLPNIPDPGALIEATVSKSNSSPPALALPRLDALNVHTQILNTYIATRSRPSEIERTSKTNRGWWVLWMRLADSTGCDQSPSSPDRSALSSSSNDTTAASAKEAFLVRKSSDYAPPRHTRNSASGSRFFIDFSGAASSSSQVGTGKSAAGSAAWAGPGKLAEGVGLDARKYIEALFNLNR